MSKPIPFNPASRIRLVPFEDIELNTALNYRIKGLIPRTGLIVLWEPPKCGKSFLVFDAVMHVALGWEYRGRKVQQGPVVYIAAEGASGFRARIAAFRQERMGDAYEGTVPFYLVPLNLDLIGEHSDLIGAIYTTTPTPAVVVIDTLNRTLKGSESRDEDMAAYIAAADAIRDQFDCAVVVVHHCGVEGSRPRGHTSLTGAADAQIAVKRDGANNIRATVEYMKDGPEGDEIASRLLSVDVGVDPDLDPITSCIVEPAEIAATADTGPKLTKNQQTMFSILHEAPDGLDVATWNERAREAGIGTSRKADLYDIRKTIKEKGLTYEYQGRWFTKQI